MTGSEYGHIHSFQSFGTVDGPGVRCVVFMQGCPLRCIYCHNPDTWDISAGNLLSADELFVRMKRYRRYFGVAGGITVSGGEPLMQPGFVRALFTLCRDAGIHTALDTSGCLLNEQVLSLLDVTDLVLLDYKMTDAAAYRHYTGCEKSTVDRFLQTLEERQIPTWLRQVIITDINDTPANVQALLELQTRYMCVQKIELLPFRKLCSEKYDALDIPFPLADCPETTDAQIQALLRTGA